MNHLRRSNKKIIMEFLIILYLYLARTVYNYYKNTLNLTGEKMHIKTQNIFYLKKTGNLVFPRNHDDSFQQIYRKKKITTTLLKAKILKCIILINLHT